MNVIISGECLGQLYACHGKKKSSICSFISMSSNFKLCHLNEHQLTELARKFVRGLDDIKIPKDFKCETCLKGKICVTSFPKSEAYRSNEILGLVHSDICGPMRIASCGGAIYFLTFIDDFFRMIFIYFLKNKSEVYSAFQNFIGMVERQTSKKLKVLRSDNGREYLGTNFCIDINKMGIKRQFSVEYTPQQNGIAERANRTIVEMARCLLIGSGLHEKFWAEATDTAVYLKNLSPNKALDGKAPYEVWNKIKPSVGHLRVFGSRVIMLDKPLNKSKFGKKGMECILIGYCAESKVYRLYNHLRNYAKVVMSNF